MHLSGDLAATVKALGEEFIAEGEAVYGIFDNASAVAVGAMTRRAAVQVLSTVAEDLAIGETVWRRSTGDAFTVRALRPDGLGLTQVTLEAQAAPTGEGVAFRFDSHFLQGNTGHKQNDHCVIKIGATFHKFTIYGTDFTATGSAYFTHYTSPDFRTWTALDNIQIGTGTPGNWRCEVWAPTVILNPNYGVQGAPLTTYKYLMFFAACSGSGAQDTYQKIGLGGCLDDDLEDWTILNGDAALYWSGMATDAYPGGAPWCPASLYNAAWCHASRDPFVWNDGADWYLLITARSYLNASRNCLGLAKFPGGAAPNWLAPDHEPAALVHATADGNWPFESSQIHYINGLWHLLFKGSNGTRHQSAAAMIGSWSGSTVAGQALTYNVGLPTTYEAGELTHLSGLRYTLGGHAAYSAGQFYYYGYVDLDFTACDVAGEHPTITPMCRIPSLLGTTGGVMDLDLTWAIIDGLGAASAFYNQPCHGDGPGDDGETPSGMTGSAYINTNYTRWSPVAALQHALNTRKGAIQSADFQITRDRMSLTVAGTASSRANFVALVNAADDRLLFIETGNDSTVLEARCWDLTTLKGLACYLVVAEMTVGTEEHIAVDVIREYQSSEEADPATASAPFAVGAGTPLAYLLAQGGL